MIVPQSKPSTAYRTVQRLAPEAAAYVAGLVDGEGTITLTSEHRGERRRLVVSISTPTEVCSAVQGCAARFTPAGPAVLTVAATRAGNGLVVATEWSSGICVARLNADGSLDSTFANAGFQTFAPPRVMRVFAAFLRSDNGITVVLHKPPNFTPREVPVFLFLTGTGAKDTGLAEGGIQAQPILALTSPDLITLQPNGKVVATQEASQGMAALIARSTSTAGVFDGGFGPFRGGYMILQTPQYPRKVAFTRDGSMLVGGDSPAAVVKTR